MQLLDHVFMHRRPTQPMQQQYAQHMLPSLGTSAGMMESQLSKLVAEHTRHNHCHTLSSHQHDCRNRLQEMYTSKALAALSTCVLRKEAYDAFSEFNSIAVRRHVSLMRNNIATSVLPQQARLGTAVPCLRVCCCEIQRDCTA